MRSPLLNPSDDRRKTSEAILSEATGSQFRQ